jgi:hypothetical protein
VGGRVAESVTTIPAKDRNGNQVIIYEVWGARRLFGLVAEHHLELATGERVEELDENSFIVIATGERLGRIKS